MTYTEFTPCVLTNFGLKHDLLVIHSNYEFVIYIIP